MLSLACSQARLVDVVALKATLQAFSVLRADGEVVVWGRSFYGLPGGAGALRRHPPRWLAERAGGAVWCGKDCQRGKGTLTFPACQDVDGKIRVPCGTAGRVCVSAGMLAATLVRH